VDGEWCIDIREVVRVVAVKEPSRQIAIAILIVEKKRKGEIRGGKAKKCYLGICETFLTSNAPFAEQRS
jgi:hypothetical protein